MNSTVLQTNPEMLETTDEIEYFEKGCQKLLKVDKIRFVGVVNKMGRLVAGGFKAGTKSFIDDKQSRMLYMQMTLELTMRKEFDETLGPIKWIASRRKNVIMISIPLNRHLLLLSTSTEAKVGIISKKAANIFKNYIN
jgi:hypothetical protein